MSTTQATQRRLLLSYTLMVAFIGCNARVLTLVPDTTTNESHHYLEPDASIQKLKHDLDIRHDKNRPPRLVWAFWFGDTMTPNRRAIIQEMQEILQVRVVLLSEHNMAPLLQWPVHPAVRFLSAVHKADYFRIYFMLHYGGGYSDLKHMVEPWAPHFAEFDSPDVWIVGVPETPGGVAVPPGASYPDDYYQKMIVNGFMISRPNNTIMRQVHNRQHAILDAVARDLELHPPPHQRCCFDHENGYPLRWAQLMGEVMAEVCGTHYSHLKRSMKCPFLDSYL